MTENRDYQRTWDQALVTRLCAIRRRAAARPLAAALAVVGVLVAVVPSAAFAIDYENPGRNGARLFVDMPDGSVNAVSYNQLVKGTGFSPTQVVQVFECPAAFPANAQDDCVRAGTALTNADGSFQTNVVVSGGMPTKNTYCAPIGTSQCFMYAATYDPVVGEVTSDAQHHLCFAEDFAWVWFPTQYLPERQPHAPCAGPLPPTDPTTTTTTAPPTGQWQPAAPLNVARRDLATAVGLDGRIYALGGTEGPVGTQLPLRRRAGAGIG